MKNDPAGATPLGVGGADIGNSPHNNGSHSNQAFRTSGPIVVLDRRAFYRDCVAKILSTGYGLTVHAMGSVEEWITSSNDRAPSLILLFVSSGSVSEQIALLTSGLEKTGRGVPFIVFSDDEKIDDIIGALEKGARGYIASTTPLEVVVEALRLVAAGGTFVPASSVIAAQRNGENYKTANQKTITDGAFTPRQSAIIEKLRIGKSNKLIAYELSMCESTVKVHVRNIMKKLNAKNRTEVAFLASRLAR